jgi:phosphoglycerate dehydrogenase-like enzyme
MNSENRLVIWDDAWLPWSAEFERRLSPGWQIAAGSGLPWLLQEVPSARALLATTLPVEARAFAEGLELMLYPGAGCSHISATDLPQGCLLTNVFEHATPVSEYVMATMLIHATRIVPTTAAMRSGSWDGSGRVGGEPHRELAGSTVGLFGFGQIGQAVATRAEAFGMNVLSVTRTRGSLSEMLPECDYFVVAAPLTEETRGRIGVAELQLLPQHAYLVNVGRAEIVCEQALYNALASGAIAGAAIDVWYRYPPPGQNGHGSRLPFHTLPNVICTPHYSAWTRPMIMRRIDRMSDSLRRLAEGAPLDRVVLEGSWHPTAIEENR